MYLGAGVAYRHILQFFKLKEAAARAKFEKKRVGEYGARIKEKEIKKYTD